MSASNTTPQRPLRADAERNRQAIICAAGRVFAQEGTGVTLEHIAEVAGVGVGTIYRRFASIDDLVAVVLEAKMTSYADRTEHAAEQALTEPWPAFRDYVMFMLEQQATDMSFSEVILDPRTATALFRREIAARVGRLHRAGRPGQSGRRHPGRLRPQRPLPASIRERRPHAHQRSRSRALVEAVRAIHAAGVQPRW